MTTPTPGRTRTLDPLARGAERYVDDLVEVRALGRTWPRRTLGMVRTPHFDVTHGESRVRIGHRVAPSELHEGLGGLIADELFGPGWLRGQELFEHIFTGVVLSSAPDPLAGWESFYRSSLRLIESAVTERLGEGSGHATIARYAPVYAHAEGLLAPGSVVELGCCFGYFSLRLAAAGRSVTGIDIEHGTTRLLAAVAARLGTPVRTITTDATHVPLPDRVAGTVVALHLLEHLDAEHGDRVLREAIRLAARRVIVAVPLEEEPDEIWGHVRTIDLGDLATWGQATGLFYDVHEHHGGWLVIDVDRPSRTRPR